MGRTNGIEQVVVVLGSDDTIPPKYLDLGAGRTNDIEPLVVVGSDDKLSYVVGARSMPTSSFIWINCVVFV